MNTPEEINIFELTENELTSVYGGRKSWAYRIGFATGRLARQIWEDIKTSHRARAEGQIQSY
ncbi:bacteriocin [Fodinibius sediminis]|uniref:bacteriocin n=1 Tax=Fodinibius sediminis TaxID=1214077 RepID=UPI001158CB4E|nr:bacteriocin [Fodinibius sediminis]